ncbi:MAG TPA: VCBS domain-containing protein, partial [Pseudomonadales bacterium]|nr:VCBS domain-containing protein [Pseudomonadales bacterium]
VVETTLGNEAGSVTEAGHADDGSAIAGTAIVTGTVSSSDVDADATATWSIMGNPVATYGSFALTEQGAWTYTLDNSLATTQALKEGDVVTLTYDVRVTDNLDAYADEQVTITIIGSNDVPEVLGTVPARELSMGDIYSFDASTLYADVDSTLTYISDNLPDGLTIDPLTGVISGIFQNPGVFEVTLNAIDDKGAISAPIIFEMDVPPIPLDPSSPAETQPSNASSSSDSQNLTGENDASNAFDDVTNSSNDSVLDANDASEANDIFSERNSLTDAQLSEALSNLDNLFDASNSFSDGSINDVNGGFTQSFDTFAGGNSNGSLDNVPVDSVSFDNVDVGIQEAGANAATDPSIDSSASTSTNGSNGLSDSSNADDSNTDESSGLAEDGVGNADGGDGAGSGAAAAAEGQTAGSGEGSSTGIR